jgi:hypothetical protein
MTQEGISSDSVSIYFPDNSVSQVTDVSVTPFEGIDVPGLPPFGYLNAATVHIAPVGKTISKNATVTFSLPVAGKYLGDSIPLLYFDKQSYSWEQSGRFAEVDTVTNTATAEITTFNTYSLGIRGTHEEEVDYYTIDSSDGYQQRTFPLQVSWQATADVKEPEVLQKRNQVIYSAYFFKKTVSQNTRLYIGRRCFFWPTYTWISYWGCPYGYYGYPYRCYVKIIVIVIYIRHYVTIYPYRPCCFLYKTEEQDGIRIPVTTTLRIYKVKQIDDPSPITGGFGF